MRGEGVMMLLLLLLRSRVGQCNERMFARTVMAVRTRETRFRSFE